MEFLKEDLERKITLKPGDQAIDFSLENSDGVEVSLRDFAQKIVVLYFYPRDGTPGCTAQACEFSTNYDKFKENGAVIIGISPDSVTSHANFRNRHNIRHILLSDKDLVISKAYGVYQVLKRYGKEYLGISRSTFVIGKDGKILKVFKNVKAGGHALKVLEELANLK